MGLLFASTRRDQVHLLSTVQQINPISVAGLSAALSWPSRKTERVVRELLAARTPGLSFDAATGLVSLGHVVPVPAARAPIAAPRPAAPTAPSAAASPPPLPTASGYTVRCSSCHVPLVPAATGEAAVCPKCGRMTARVRAAPTPAAAPSGPVAPAPPPDNGRTVVHEGDRRSQELFAAWVTARPIPCPRCRTTLRHRGVGEYGCPSCGHRVAFETSVGHLATPAPAPSPAA